MEAIQMQQWNITDSIIRATGLYSNSESMVSLGDVLVPHILIGYNKLHDPYIYSAIVWQLHINPSRIFFLNMHPITLYVTGFQKINHFVTFDPLNISAQTSQWLHWAQNLSNYELPEILWNILRAACALLWQCTA